MSTWPLRADGSATFNDALTAGAGGISAASTSMSYATMESNLSTQLNDNDTILFGGDGGEFTANGSILFSQDNVTVEGQADNIPVIDLGGLWRIQTQDADKSLFRNLFLKDPSNSGIEWKSAGTGKNLTGSINNIYVTGSTNQAFSVEPAVNDTMHIEANKVVGVNGADDGWSMHERATANIRNSVFSGNTQGFNGVVDTVTKFYNCMFLQNTGAGLISGDAVLAVDIDGGEMTAEFYDCIFDGNLVCNPSNNTRKPTFKAVRCKFYGNYVSNDAGNDDAIIHFGGSTNKNITASFDDCDFYRSISGKFMFLLRGTDSTYTINNCRITDVIKNTSFTIFLEANATSSITNNEFRHLGTALGTNTGSIVTNNNFIDVDTIGGSGSTITGSTFKFPNELFMTQAKKSGMIRSMIGSMIC